MTNLPTLGGILFFAVMLTFIPFWFAFIISYVSYRQLKAGLLGGILGVIFFFLTIYFSLPLYCVFWIRGLISGYIGGIITVIFLSKYYKSYLPTTGDKINIISRKNIVLIVVTVVLLFSVFQYYSFARKSLEFNKTDPEGDVSYSGYSEPRLSGHSNIDILRLESNVVGDHVILEMEIAGEITKNTTAEYTFFIATGRQGLWTDRIDMDEMEKNDSILRAKIPIERLKDRKIFHVLAVASETDIAVDLGLYDNCSNRNVVEDILNMLL